METVQKTIENSQLQYCDEMVDVPAVLVEQIPHVHVVAKTPEIPQLQITDKVIDVPVVSAMQVPRVCAVKKTAETPQLQVVDVPVQLVAQVPRVEVVEEAVEIPQLPLVKKIGVIPETIEIPLGTNSGSSVGSTQQQHNHHRKQQQQQAGQTEEEEKEEGERRKGERGKEEERDAEEQECKQVKKDATGWTVVTRNKRQRKMVQIYVKVDGGKISTMEVKMSDRVDDIVKRTPISDQDVYVTSDGRMLRRSDKLESCEVRDGSTVEITSRMRGGEGQEEQSGEETRHEAGATEKLGPAILESEKEAVIQMLEETEEYRKIVDDVSGGSDVDMEWKMRYWASKLRERPGADVLECGLRWAVEARRKGRDKQEEQRRQAKQGRNTEQEQSKHGASKCVSAKNNSWRRRE